MRNENEEGAAARTAALAWRLEATPLPPAIDLTGCFSDFPLASALNPRVEHWNEVNLRVLDVWVKVVKAPGFVELCQTPSFEEFEDRHRLVREALRGSAHA